MNRTNENERRPPWAEDALKDKGGDGEKIQQTKRKRLQRRDNWRKSVRKKLNIVHVKERRERETERY